MCQTKPRSRRLLHKRPSRRLESSKPTAKTITDREALQGLWVVEKVDIGKAPKHAGEARELIGKMHFLIAGDVWWSMLAGQSAGRSQCGAD